MREQLLLSEFDTLVVDEADVILETERSVVPVDLDVKDLCRDLTVTVVANIVLPKNELQRNRKFA